MRRNTRLKNEKISFSKGGFKSEDSGKFLLNKKIFQICILSRKFGLFTVMGGKFKFSAQDRNLEYFFGEVKLVQYLLI